MAEETENKNSDNHLYKLENLCVLPQTGCHAYTQFSIKGKQTDKLCSTDLNEYCLKYPYIENIDISHNQLKSMNNLNKFKYLRWLNASYNQLTAFDLNVEWNIEENTGNKSLLKLNISHNNIIKLDCLSQHIHLEILDLSYNKLQNIDALKSLHLLKNLNIEHNKIKDLSPLNDIAITELNASYNNIDKMDKMDNNFSENIKILNINNNNIANLECTQQFAQLTEFYIAKNHISDFEQLSYLIRLSLLRQLDIRQNRIKYKNIDCDQDLEYEILFILPDLQFLNGDKIEPKLKIESRFKHNVFNDKLISIKQYYDSNGDNQFDDNQNEIALENENEFWYRICEEEFAIFWEKFITKFPNLSATKIDLTDIQIGSAGLHAICDSIQQCPNLTHLILTNSLSINRWSDTKYQWPLKYLSDTLLINNTLQLLDLSNCCIDAIKLKPIAFLIENSSSLNTLNLNYNNIGQHILDKKVFNIITPCPAIKLLTASILKSDSLKHLFINHNEMDGLSAYFIGKCLQNEQCQLEQLDISYNPFKINGNGFGEIAKSIKINKYLKQMNISYCIRNQDDAEYMEQVLHSLKENKYLEYFDISGNVLSKNAMKYLLLAIQINVDIKYFKMKDIVIETETFNLIQSALSNKDNLIELSMDIQKENNMQQIFNSIASHSNLQSLYLSNIQQQKQQKQQYQTSLLSLESNIIQQALSPLIIIDLSKLYISSTYIGDILDALCQSNESLINLNLESSELNGKCWNLLTKLCNKLKLQKLNVSQCSINNDCHILGEFFQSQSMIKSLNYLNMANMKWNNNEPIMLFQKLFYELRCIKAMDIDKNKNREFTLNLTKLPIHEDNIINNTDCMDHLFKVLSNIGVKTLILDDFMITNTSKTNTITKLDIINEIFHCFKQNRYKISSLSIKHDINCIHSENQNISPNDASFVTVINSIKLQHIALPKINDKATLMKLLCNLRNSRLKTVKLGNDIDDDTMNIIIQLSNHNKLPQIRTDEFLNIASKSMDYKLNQYMSNISCFQCCRL